MILFTCWKGNQIKTLLNHTKVTTNIVIVIWKLLMDMAADVVFLGLNWMVRTMSQHTTKCRFICFTLLLSHRDPNNSHYFLTLVSQALQVVLPLASHLWGLRFDFWVWISCELNLFGFSLDSRVFSQHAYVPANFDMWVTVAVPHFDQVRLFQASVVYKLLCPDVDHIVSTFSILNF